MEALRLLLRDLWAEKGRNALVALGVTWGTLSLTLLVSFGWEFVAAMNQVAANYGRSILRVSSGFTSAPFEGLPAGRFVELGQEDADLIGRAVPGLRGVSVEHSRMLGNPARYRDRQLNATLIGVEASFGELRNFRPEPGGRFIDREDERLNRRVAFLGHRVRDHLFGEEDALGETIEVWGQPFTVIGVLARRTVLTNNNGEEPDKIAIPASVYRELTGRQRAEFLVVSLRDPAEEQRVERAIRELLGGRHRFDPADEDALDVFSVIELEQMIGIITSSNRALVVVVGLLGLLVAAVGVGNVIFLMVQERSREIGVQIAIGARPRQVAAARLVEGLALTLSGGLAGMLVATVLLELAATIPMDPEARAYLGTPRVSFGVAGAVVLILMTVGGLAGWLPGRRAAALDPVVALREE
ncbi:MAG: ABC transporter permease [Planctomycetes bacterium]|nr:ABC transporter permease [Planctomycetota bacterium]